MPTVKMSVMCQRGRHDDCEAFAYQYPAEEYRPTASIVPCRCECEHQAEQVRYTAYMERLGRYGEVITPMKGP